MDTSLGGFSFHLREATVFRILPLLPDNRPPTFMDVRRALLQITEEDRRHAQTQTDKA